MPSIKRTVSATLFLATFLVSCSSDSPEPSNPVPSGPETSVTGPSGVAASVGKTPPQSSVAKVTVKKVVVNSNCIGCWKCVRIDPTHFKADFRIRKAVGVSAEGGEYSLERAVRHCPVDAISVG